MDKVAKENKLPMRDVSEILRSIYFVPYIVDVTESNKQIGTSPTLLIISQHFRSLFGYR